MRTRYGGAVAVLLCSVLVFSAAAADTEPNDSCATADPAASSASGSLGGSDTQDWWSFELRYGERVVVQMDPGASNFDLELYDPSCSLRSGQYRPGTAGEQTVEVANPAGRYYARIILSSGAGPYTLSIAVDPNIHVCEASGLVAAGARTESGSGPTCDLPPMGDVLAGFVVTVTSGAPGVPGGIVQAAIDETGIACGPALGSCAAAAIAPGGAGHRCRATVLTAAASVRLRCEARPAAP